MSNFRQRAREIKALGVAERDNWTPPATPLRMYQFWVKNSKNAPVRENFCHFWRVVAIWAPLMFLRRTFVNFVESKVGAIVTVAVLVAGLILASLASVDFRSGLLVLLGIVYVFAGAVSGGIMVTDAVDDEDDDIEAKVLRAVFWVTIPVSGIVYLAVKAVQAWPKRWTEPVVTVLVYLIGFAAACALAALLVALYLAEGWLGLAILFGGLIGFVAVLAGLFVLSDYIAGRRIDKEAKDREARWAYFDEHGIWPEEVEQEPKKPGKVKKFFTGIGDFIILMAQIVRVKKWKICPMVDIKDNHAA